MTWTVRKVVKEQMSDEVDALVLKKDPGATCGSNRPFSQLVPIILGQQIVTNCQSD
jgi:3-methyladenine DNA glycosylase/8-oxoguanine DNA glycosylase